MIWRAHRRPQLTCRTVARLIQAYIDGELRDPRAVLVADHLDRCLECGLDAQTWRWLKQTVSHLQPPDDPERIQRLRSFVNALVEYPGSPP